MHNPAENDDPRLYRRSPSPSTQEYQTKLLDKLTALVGVIDIAIARVRASMARRQGDPSRLQEILDNLSNTRSICMRARAVIEKRLGPSVPKAGASKPRRVSHQPPGGVSYREYVEMGSAEEIKKFKDKNPISKDEVTSCDINSLLEQLMGNGGTDPRSS